MSSTDMPSPLAQPAEQVEHLGLHGHVQRAGRLVGQQHLGPQRQRERDRHPLQLPAGQLRRVPVQQVRRQQHLAHGLGRRVRRLAPGSSRAAAARAARRWPTLNTGLNAMAGLWKIAAIRRPRISRSARWDSPVSSVPSSRMLPLTVAPTVCARPSTASVVIDLPEPLSPASPTISARPAPNSSMPHHRPVAEPHLEIRDRQLGTGLMAAGSVSGRAGRAARRRAG